MTVSKSQGHSLNVVRVDFRGPAFTHGQLYVALSRATDVDSLKVLQLPDVPYTENVVYPEVLLR